MTENDNQRALRVLQLTDPHLMSDPGGELLGVNTRDSLDAVIAQAVRDHGDADLILATGDIAQDASEDAYRLFGEKLKACPCGSAWIAGNHDDSPLLNRIAAESNASARHPASSSTLRPRQRRPWARQPRSRARRVRRRRSFPEVTRPPTGRGAARGG